MNKEQFFSELEESLQGEVSDAEYRDSLNYYREYFREQESLGKSEQEILDQLGSARLIAHSIIDARGLENQVSHGNTHYRDAYEDYQNTRQEYEDEVVNDPQPGPVENALGKIARIAVIIGVLLVLGMMLHFLLPVILVVIAVIVISSFFRS